MYPQKVTVREMNPHLICALCGGYFVDATTIIECLHSFCKSCIVKHLETSKYCPICDVQVHKTRPLENIRPDHILQEIVYKLVPGLYKKEMRNRKEFYVNHQDIIPTNLEAKGEISEDCRIFFPDENIMLSLEYLCEDPKSHQSSCNKRYLRCPAAVTLSHLQKLIRSKFGVVSNCKVDIFYKEELLPDYLSLLDVAYIYQWRRKNPLHLSYRIMEVQCKIIKPIREEVEKEEPVPNEDNPEKEKEVVESSAPEISEQSKSWKEVQLQISENGVMSIADANTNPPPKECAIDENKSKESSENDLKKSEVQVKNEENVEKSEKPNSPKVELKESDVSTGTQKEEPVEAKPQNLKEETKEMTEKNDVVKPDSEAEVKNEALIVKDAAPKVLGLVAVVKDKEPAAEMDSIRKTPKVKDPKSTVQEKETVVEKPKVISVESLTKMEVSTPKPNQAVESTKKVCKVEPSVMGLPSGLSITQRPAIKTYPGLKPINKEEMIKSNSGLSKEVSIKPIVSICTSSATFPGKNNSSNSLKIPNSAPPIVPPSIKKPPPIRYKTLKSPTKPWNPSIPRSSMLMMKQNSSDNDPNQSKGNVKPPKFFKMRNVPRYLGNPASGVKPMYQAPETSSSNSEQSQNSKDGNSTKCGNSSVTLMKIDPKTLSPIVASSCPNPPSISTNSIASPHPKKSPLPPPFTPGSPKLSPVSKSKPVISNKTPAHGTPIPSPAHSNSLLSSNPFLHTANQLMYPSFPHPFSHPESAANRILAGTNSSDLIRAMSSLCPPTAAFHPSLPPSLSMLFNSHQVGFPRLNQNVTKTATSKQSSTPMVSVSSASTHTTTAPKPKKSPTDSLNRSRPNLTIETSSRYNALYANGFLPSPTERHKSVSPKGVNKCESDKKYSNKTDHVSKNKTVKPSNVSDKKPNPGEKMDVDPPKNQNKHSNTDCDRDSPVNSNKRLKKDDSNSLESNNNLKARANPTRGNLQEGTSTSSEASKDKPCEVKLELSSTNLPNNVNKNNIKQENISINDSSSVSSNSVLGNNKPLKVVDKPRQNDCDDNKDKVSNETSSVSTVENGNQSVDKVSKPDVNLSVVNNNCKTSSSDTKIISSLVCTDSVPKVN